MALHYGYLLDGAYSEGEVFSLQSSPIIFCKLENIQLTWEKTNSCCERSISSCGVTSPSLIGSHHFCGAALSTSTNLPTQSVIAQAKYWPSRNNKISHTTAGTKLERDTVFLHHVSHLHPWMISIKVKAMTAGMMKNADENTPFHVGLQGHSNSSSTSFSSPMRIKPKATFDTRGLLLSSFFSLVSHCCLLSILDWPKNEDNRCKKPKRGSTVVNTLATAKWCVINASRGKFSPRAKCHTSTLIGFEQRRVCRLLWHFSSWLVCARFQVGLHFKCGLPWTNWREGCKVEGSLFCSWAQTGHLQ